MFTWWSPPYQGCFLSQPCTIFRCSAGAVGTAVLNILDKTGHLFFFRSTHVYRSKHAPKVMYDLSPCEFALGFRAASKMNLSVTKLWSTGASSGELNKKWLSFSQASTAIFPFRISGNRGTSTITKDVLCGEFQRHVGRRQRK